MSYSSKVYCKGLSCKKRDRKKQCNDCGVWICGQCSINDDKKTYCIDCFTIYHLPTKDIIIDVNADIKYTCCD